MEKKIQRHPFRSRAARRRGGQAVPAQPTRALTPAQWEHLEALNALCGRLGRTPLREELPPYLRMELAVSFGSLRGAFLCLGRVPPMTAAWGVTPQGQNTGTSPSRMVTGSP